LRQALAKPNEQARAANPNGKAPSRHSPFHHTEKEAHQTTYQGEDFALFFFNNAGFGSESQQDCTRQKHVPRTRTDYLFQKKKETGGILTLFFMTLDAN